MEDLKSDLNQLRTELEEKDVQIKDLERDREEIKTEKQKKSDQGAVRQKIL